nr:polyprotein 1a [Raspberry leaf mottle virus]
MSSILCCINSGIDSVLLCSLPDVSCLFSDSPNLRGGLRGGNAGDFWFRYSVLQDFALRYIFNSHTLSYVTNCFTFIIDRAPSFLLSGRDVVLRVISCIFPHISGAFNHSLYGVLPGLRGGSSLSLSRVLCTIFPVVGITIADVFFTALTYSFHDAIVYFICGVGYLSGGIFSAFTLCHLLRFLFRTDWTPLSKVANSLEDRCRSFLSFPPRSHSSSPDCQTDEERALRDLLVSIADLYTPSRDAARARLPDSEHDSDSEILSDFDCFDVPTVDGSVTLCDPLPRPEDFSDLEDDVSPGLRAGGPVLSLTTFLLTRLSRFISLLIRKVPFLSIFRVLNLRFWGSRTADRLLSVYSAFYNPFQFISSVFVWAFRNPGLAFTNTLSTLRFVHAPTPVVDAFQRNGLPFLFDDRVVAFSRLCRWLAGDDIPRVCNRRCYFPVATSFDLSPVSEARSVNFVDSVESVLDLRSSVGLPRREVIDDSDSDTTSESSTEPLADEPVVKASKGKAVLEEILEPVGQPAEASTSEKSVLMGIAESHRQETLSNVSSSVLPGPVVPSRRPRSPAKDNVVKICGYLQLLNSAQSVPTGYDRDSSMSNFSAMTNSIREFYYSQEVTLYELYSKLFDYWREFVVLKHVREVCSLHQDEDCIVVDFIRGEMVYKTGRKSLKGRIDAYSFGFCSDGLIPVELMKGKYDYCLVHTQTTFIAANHFLNSAPSRAIKFTNESVKIRVYEAPPGGGKTYALVESFCNMVPKRSVVVVTANKNSQIEISKRVKNLLVANNWKYHDAAAIVKESVFTVDSYLMHHAYTKSHVVLIDECFMVHAGAVCAVLTFTGASLAVLYGDSRQIHYIHRNDLGLSLLHDINNFLSDDSRVYGNVSYRCPWDVCAWLSEIYPTRIQSMNEKSAGTSSMSVTEISCVEDVPLDQKFKYITYTQGEKRDLSKHLAVRATASNCKKVPEVNTVHEVQGDTFAHVCLVRFKYQDDSPFSSQNHIIVALSRHTDSLVYHVLSTRRYDDTSSAIAKSKLIVAKFKQYPGGECSSTLSWSKGPYPDKPGECKAASSPYQCITQFLEDAVPGSTVVDFGDTSLEMSEQPFESGADNVTIKETTSRDSGSVQDPRRV